MNIISALKKLENGKFIKRPNWSLPFCTVLEFTNSCFLEVEDYFAEDWEIVTTKKVVVFENVAWPRDPETNEVKIPWGEMILCFGKLNIPHVKVTLE